ncbi:kinase domain-containing protein [Aspergillus pseudoustus]|uniref:non-specific serine/threonine protein kinase n=1 Tax=Aspergillus pseudoustus TaxID=1810923 RepID=A0ABR4J6S2_9EURO
MDLQRQFPNVHYIWGGGISFVYEVDPRIVVKVPQTGEFEKEQFKKEVAVYDLLWQHPLCPFIVECFLYTPNGIFLEYMRDGLLASRIQNNHTRDDKTYVVTKVDKLEPLRLRKQWMSDLTAAVAFLESLGLAHGDLRPENILLDRDRIKLSDFDSTDEIGNHFEACMAPYGRLLNGSESHLGLCGSAGRLGPRTEQFALGSLFYYINYGFEVYGDRCLAEDPREHGPTMVDELQHMKFPDLHGDEEIDAIIDKCWHNKYAKVADLAVHTHKLLAEHTETVEDDEHKGASSDNSNAEDPEHAGGATDGEVSYSREDICEDLEARGLLEILSSAEPEKLGFKLEWYRHPTTA